MIALGTVARVNPPQFLQAVLDVKGLTGTGLARAINRPGTQGSISKFLSGTVQDPRGTWVRPSAKHLGFDPAALRDDDVAEREAQRLGLLSGQPSRPRATPARRTGIDPGVLALQIADLMRGYSQPQRDLAAPLFHGAAKDPDEAPRIAAALRALLATPPEKRTGTSG